MATLLLQRKKDLIDLIQPLSVFIDGKKISDIKYGQLVSIDLAAGMHTLTISTNWEAQTSLSFEIEQDQVKKYQLANKLNIRLAYGFLILSGFLPLLLLYFAYNTFERYIYFYVILFSILSVVITIYRQKDNMVRIIPEQ